ncbi:ATP-binding response regulator [Vibrio mangrovi]|uniref:histidine kinase n=1 Tax=Vibrio mangrovi TaxID=474394 RepID=A0A1Y6IU27_9VIBR|nr:hybrid sensor histidine kinase/response regulator [Vibrio mangrovi]MDW6003655.1 hybrid sensor histidine kinase/response regulator [Vibrio mangrovi]SMR99553.1 Autoinducer 1 sensor kinase/phosphatase LuxN [Vibrio mangrovi]
MNSIIMTVEEFFYAKSLLLLFIAGLVLAWLIYFLLTLKKQGASPFKTIYSSYIVYSIFIMLWILSNSYFHSGLLTIYSSQHAIMIAKAANIFSYMAFASAFHFSCRITSKSSNNSLTHWQYLILIIFTTFALYTNIAPNYTIASIDIYAPSKFTIHFGSLTSLFFLSVIILTCITLLNLTQLIRGNDKLKKLKSIYMIIGIITFMLSTAIIHTFVTYVFNDFSLTWLPPALSVTELLFMGYAVLCHRFYSWRYLMYTSICMILTAIVYITPIIVLQSWLAEDKNHIVIISFWCLLCGLTWKNIWQLFSQYVGLWIYGDRKPPVERILSLVDDFQISTQQAIQKLERLLNLEQAILVSDINSNSIYVSYFQNNYSVLLIEEIEQYINNSHNKRFRQIRDLMSKNESAMILPIYDHHNILSQLLISPKKNDGSLYSNEEINAIQQLLKKAQIYIHYEAKIHQSQAMAKSIAHEMRNPLSQIQFHLEKLDNLILSSQLPQNLRDEIQRGKNAVQHGSQLIDIILHEVNQSIISQDRMTTLSIRKQITLIINRFAYNSSLFKNRITLKASIDFDIYVNDTLFDFIIFNLLRNAVYYFDTFSDSKIELVLETSNEYNRLIFTDYGPGIEPQILHRIFDEFFTYQKQGGSGLGLSYCKRAMKLFGGDIQCQSVYGEYTRFILTFPHVKQSEQEEQHPRPNIRSAEVPIPELLVPDYSVAGNDIKKVALVTDDNPTQRALTKLYLESLHFTVYEAENGEEAVDMVHHKTIDIVFMDVQMPVMNGLKACSLIKETHPTLPVIALSGESGEDEISQIKRTMDDWLVKPTTKQLLQKTVLKWLEEDATQIVVPEPQIDAVSTI